MAIAVIVRTSAATLSPALASTWRHQVQVLLNAALLSTMMLVLENGRAFAKMSPLAWGQVRGGEAGAQEPLAEGCRPARKLVTTRANFADKSWFHGR